MATQSAASKTFEATQFKPTPNNLEAFFMPFTSNRAFKAKPRLFVKAEGMHYTTIEGRKVLDASAGLWCMNCGHGRKEISEAVAHQIREMDYSPPFNMGHPASFELASRVAALLPAGLDHVFFTNSGSESVDSALKIALAYHRAKGQPQRTRFVSRAWGYHGVNLGGTSLAGMVGNRREFGAVTCDVVHMRHTWADERRFTRGQPEDGADLADDLEALCQTYGPETIAAVFVEPIAGSVGTIVPPKGYLERLRAIADKYGILLVFDEVITGFGRTGEAFAAQEFGVTPDVMTMAKALTNGAIPMSAVAVRTEIQKAVIDSIKADRPELMHGYTYSAHPVACAAALAALEIYRSEGLFARGKALSQPFLDAVFGLRNLPQVYDLRGYGMLAGIQLAPGRAPGEKGSLIQRLLFDEGLHVKATGDALLFAPALVASEEDIGRMTDILRKVLGRTDLDALPAAA